MAAHDVRWRGILLGLSVTLLSIGCGKDGPRPGQVVDEASTGRPGRRLVPRGRRGLLPGHGRRGRPHARGSAGAQYLDRVDGR